MTAKCIVCGAEFEARGFPKYCPKCARQRKNVYFRKRRHEIKFGEQGDISEMHPCLYCGRPTKKVYCTRCISEGWDGVHKVTGKSNGWESGKVREHYDLDKDVRRVSDHSIPIHDVHIDLKGYF